MESTNQTTHRYPDADLAEFKIIIDKKLASAYEEVDYLREQIESNSENIGKEGDYMDGSTNFSDLEMLQTMQHRLLKQIQHLENALWRIRNKTYGVCAVTGELIDKRRLLAVPTTTQSISVKLAGKPAPEHIEELPSGKVESQTFSKVISKPKPPKPTNQESFDDLGVFEDDDDVVGRDPDYNSSNDFEEMDDD